MDMSLNKFQEIGNNREACCVAAHGVARKGSDTTERLNSNGKSHSVKSTILSFRIYLKEILALPN